MHLLGSLGVPLCPPPPQTKRCYKEPFWGFLWKEHGSVLLNHKLGVAKNHLGFLIALCGIHERFFKEPLGFHITTLLLTMRVLSKPSMVNCRILF